jgi:antitoxin YefM
MQVISYSAARNNLKSVLDRVSDDADVTVINRRDGPDAVVMSLDTFNSWQETLFLMSNPANATHLAESVAQHKAGKVMQKALIDA